MFAAERRSLHEVLSALAPAGAGAGETKRTPAKETLDADDEAVLQEVLIDG